MNVHVRVRKDDTIVGGEPRSAGYTTEMPQFAAKKRARAGDLEIIPADEAASYDSHGTDSGDTDERTDPDTDPDTEPDKDTDTERTTEAEDTTESGTDEQSGPFEGVPFEDVTGIGASTADEIREHLRESSIDTVDDLRDTDLTDLPNVSDSRAEELAEVLEGLE